MPHNRGHTTIEMTSPGERHNGSHENPRAHEAPIIIAPGYNRSPSPGNRVRHSQPHDNNHLTVGNGNSSSHPAIHNNHRTNNHKDPIIFPDSRFPPEDSTPLLHRSRRSPSPEPSSVVNDKLSPVAVNDDLAKPNNHGFRLNINTANDKNKNQPLKEPDVTSQKPPIAGPEMDDLDEELDIPNTPAAHPGVDDGFFPISDDNGHPDDDGTKTVDDEGTNGINLNPEDLDAVFNTWNNKHDDDDGKPHDEGDGMGLSPHDPRLTPRFNAESPFPYAPEFSPGAVPPQISPDVNVYQQKKNLAQGMMDLALLSANANQLRYVLEAGTAYHPYYYASLIFISASLILQIGVGVGLIINSTYDIKDRYEVCKADRINNFTVIGIFLITVVNVFIASFGVAQLPAPSSNSGS